MPIQKLDGPTLDDFFQEGQAMESGVRSVTDINHANNEPAREAASECRQLAIGIVAIALSYMSDLTENMSFDPKLTYCLGCTVAFAQGAVISSSLISQSHYMKAAAALKQDVELLARFHEVVQDRAVEGKTPQMSGLPEEGRRAYGELNKLAHPSNLEEMH